MDNRVENAPQPEAEDDRLHLDRQVCFRLYAATNLITRLYRPLLDEIGLTYPQYLVMLVLWEVEPQTVSSLGNKLYLDSGTLTPLLKRMEAAGYVLRRRDSADERCVLVELTGKGRALREAARRIPEAMGKDTSVSPDAIEKLRLSLYGLITELAEAQPSLKSLKRYGAARSRL